MFADAADGDAGGNTGPAHRTAAAGTMTAVDAILLSAFEDRVLGNDLAKVEDPDEIR